MNRFLFIIIVALSFNSIAQTYTLNGLVLKKGDGSLLPGANVFLLETNQGSFSDKEGRFSIHVKEGDYSLRVSYVGYALYEQKIAVKSDTLISIYLEQNEKEIKEVTITNNRAQQNINNPQAGMVKLSVLDIKKLPTFLGESDPIKAIRLTPGVQAGGEGNAGIFVRGGDPGQNLILLEDMPIYNASHLLGIYSVFNPSIIKSVSLYKGAYPASYGGRASSLIKIGLNDGIADKTEAEGSLGILSSSAGIKTSILNGKGSLLLGGRYTDIHLLQSLFKLFNVYNKTLENNLYNFYDLNARIEVCLNSKNRIILNSYSGIDNYKSTQSSIKFSNLFRWGNQAATLKWYYCPRSSFSFSNIIGYTNYNFSLKAKYKQYGVKLKSNIADPFFRSEVFVSTLKHNVLMGIEATYHNITPEGAEIIVDNARHNNDLNFRSGEISVFANDSYELSPKISAVMGLRGTLYSHLGVYNNYIQNSQGLVIDTIRYAKNKKVKNYFGIEPRLSVVYKCTSSSSLKASLSRTYQYIHLISVGTVSLPTDIWFPSTANVKPEFTDQFTLGYFRNLKDNAYETSAELYFKNQHNAIEFKNSMTTNFRYNEFEKSIAHGKGYAFGSEFYLKKNKGIITGWISYTISWSIRKFNDINEGEYFFGKYDRRHDLAISAQYNINESWNISSVFIYSSGNAMTLPTGRYMIQGEIINDYSSVNSFRMPAYHRMDISATYTKKIHDKYESIWNFSIYNVYNRANPYYVFFDVKSDLDNYYLSVKAKKVSLFPILPSISWKFKF